MKDKIINAAKAVGVELDDKKADAYKEIDENEKPA